MCGKRDSSPERLTPIQQFYNGKVVFVTGGTGFLGKVLIEKLIRSCTGFRKLYLLIRPKKSKSIEERIKELFNDALFDHARKVDPDFMTKIVPVPGDCSQPGLGISDEHHQMILEDVEVIFHGAATVRFDENLKKAVQINVLGTQAILNICHLAKHLKCFVHVSTAYSFCNRKTISEKVHEQSPNQELVLRLAKELTEEEIESKTQAVLGTWPNTYTLTKSLAENIIQRAEGHLPIAIFRPGIVTCTNAEPVPGWVDNLLGPTGVIVGAGCGVIRVTMCDTNKTANIVPVDLVVNGLLAAGYEIDKNFRNENREIQVYNFVSCADNPLTYSGFMGSLAKHGVRIPPDRALWYYSLTLTSSRFLMFILGLILHTIPGLLIDGACILTGKKPQMTRLYIKVHKMIDAISYFAVRSWNFETDNLKGLWSKTSEEDKKLFNFDITTVDWDLYLENYIRGARVYILKDDMSTVPHALKKWRRLWWYHQMTKYGFLSLLIYSAWCLVGVFLPVLA